jgi:hypothetical protein
MQDTGLFLSLAEIAGVFVGFGALISVRSGGTLEVDEVAELRLMVWMGVLTVVAGLAPVTLSRYDLTGHQVWALSSVVALAGSLVMVVSLARTPEYRANAAAMVEADRTRSRWVVVVEAVAWVLYMIALVLAPLLVILGVAPGLEAAFYFTVVVLILLGAAWELLILVLSQRHQQTATNPVAPPATGGPSA